MCPQTRDRSREYVDGSLLIDNDGLHGMRMKCNSRFLAPGDHFVTTEGFSGGGGVGQEVYYSGPDTAGRVLMRSGVACSASRPNCH